VRQRSCVPCAWDDRSKLWVLPEGVDLDHFAPDTVTPLPLHNQRSFRFLSVFKARARRAPVGRWGRASACFSLSLSLSLSLSVCVEAWGSGLTVWVAQWEERKGWDVLLRAYVREFRADEDVCLVLHTYLFRGAAPRDVRRPYRDCVHMAPRLCVFVSVW
jgi:hypothetical protein